MAPTLFQVLLAGSAALLYASSVYAEKHTIKFDNRCGKGKPQLLLGGKVVSNGEPYTSNGPVVAGIAYLQTGECGYNGEKCSLMEMTIQNPTCPGCGSSTDISLIAPHAFNVETSFSYYGGCDGQGATCSSGNCKSAFFKSDDNQVQVQCEANDVNLLITFCGDATKAAKGNNAGGAPTIGATSSAAASSSAAPVNVAVPPSSSSTAPVKTSSPVAASSVSTSSVSAPSSTPNRKSCRNARRSDDVARDLDALLRRADEEARALYDVYDHLQRAQSKHKAARRHSH